MSFFGPSYHLQDRKAAVQSSVNCFLQKLDNDSSYMMASAPGEYTIAILGGEGRGTHVVGDRLFIVVGNTLWEKNPANDTFTSRYVLGTSSGFVGFADNNTQMGFVDGPSYYVMDLASNVVDVVAPAGWLGSADIYELDGYFVFVRPDSDQFYISAIDDAKTLNPLDFSSADSAPGNIIAHRVSHRQLWFFKPFTTEIWVDSGDNAFPFVRYSSYTLEIGIVGPRAAIVAADTLLWIGQTRRGQGIVYMASGNQPQRVSTLAVEEALRGSSDLSAATMWAYQDQGHEFIGINAPGLSSTWVYDAATGQWHERAEWSGGWQPLRSRLHVTLKGEHYALDPEGNVVRLDSALNNLSGRPLRRERTWPHFIQPGLEPASYRSLELAMFSGSGGNVALQVSNDGGYTFGAPLLRSLGVTGRFMQRMRWMPLGSAINRVFRIWVTDDVPFAIHHAAVDASA